MSSPQEFFTENNPDVFYFIARHTDGGAAGPARILEFALYLRFALWSSGVCAGKLPRRGFRNQSLPILCANVIEVVIPDRLASFSFISDLNLGWCCGPVFFFEDEKSCKQF